MTSLNSLPLALPSHCPASTPMSAAYYSVIVVRHDPHGAPVPDTLATRDAAPDTTGRHSISVCTHRSPTQRAHSHLAPDTQRSSYFAGYVLDRGLPTSSTS